MVGCSSVVAVTAAVWTTAWAAGNTPWLVVTVLVLLATLALGYRRLRQRQGLSDRKLSIAAAHSRWRLPKVFGAIQAHKAVAAERTRLQATLESMLDPLILAQPLFDDTGRVTDFLSADINHAACEWMGKSREEVLGKSLLGLFPALETTGLMARFRETATAGQPASIDDVAFPFNGTHWVDVRAVRVDERVSIAWRDATKRHHTAAALAASEERYRRLAEALDHRVRIDELTNLLNRKEVLERIGAVNDQCRRTGKNVAVLLCDIDRFKSVNDTYGHAAGDAVLRAVADRIRSCLRTSDDVGARIGGDELLVVLYGVRDLDDAVAVAKKLRGQVAKPILFAGRTISTTISIGATLVRPEETADALIARADDAMYRAKAGGRNRVVVIGAEAVTCAPKLPAAGQG
ncbi:MAG: diguanylate cyclase [Pirellulales bacterium]